MQLVIQNQCKGPGNDCVALTTKLEVFSHASHHVLNAVLSGYITTLKNKQKLDVLSEGPSSRVSSHHVLSVCKISFDLSQ